MQVKYLPNVWVIPGRASPHDRSLNTPIAYSCGVSLKNHSPLCDNNSQKPCFVESLLQQLSFSDGSDGSRCSTVCLWPAGGSIAQCCDAYWNPIKFSAPTPVFMRKIPTYPCSKCGDPNLFMHAWDKKKALFLRHCFLVCTSHMHQFDVPFVICSSVIDRARSRDAFFVIAIEGEEKKTHIIIIVCFY